MRHVNNITKYNVFDFVASILNLGQFSTDGQSKNTSQEEVKRWKQVKKHLLKKRT